MSQQDADNRVLTECMRGKIAEALDRLDHLIWIVPCDRLDWSPAAQGNRATRAFTLGELLGHLVDCAAGFCAAFIAAFPSELSGFSALRQLCAPGACSPGEASQRIAKLSQCIEQGFEVCTDKDLSRTVPTVFISGGERLLTLLLGNFEHLTNHKAQFFLYLKLLGIQVETPDLYHLRDPQS